MGVLLYLYEIEALKEKDMVTAHTPFITGFHFAIDVYRMPQVIHTLSHSRT